MKIRAYFLVEVKDWSGKFLVRDEIRKIEGVKQADVVGSFTWSIIVLVAKTDAEALRDAITAIRALKNVKTVIPYVVIKKN